MAVVQFRTKERRGMSALDRVKAVTTDRQEHNAMLIARIVGVAASAASAESDADPQNPNPK